VAIVLGDVGGVDHDEEVVGLDPVDDEVVHNAALGMHATVYMARPS